LLSRQYLDEGAVGRPEHILAVNYVPYATLHFDMGYRNTHHARTFLQKATQRF